MKQDNYKGGMAYSPQHAPYIRKSLDNWNKEIRKIELEARTKRLIGNQNIKIDSN